MILWITYLNTLAPLTEFPRISVVSAERQRDVSYHHEGRFRQGERHVLFKYTLKGEGRFRDHQGEHPLPEGTAFLCRIQDPDTAYYYPPEGSGQAWDFLYVTIAGEVAQTMASELISTHGALFQIPREHRLIQGLLGLRRRKLSHQPTSPGTNAGLTMRFLGDLAELACQPDQQVSHLLIHRAQEFIETHLESNLNAGDVAAALQVSREHFSRLFSRQVGLSPYKYILRRKMLGACRLLKESSLPAKIISSRFGYDEPAHFSRIFKATIGLTPTAFRKHGSVPLQ